VAIPIFLDGSYRYFTRGLVTDVQTIIDDLYAELVTGLGWTCTVGGIGNPDTTYKSPVGSMGEFFTINLQRVGVTPITTLLIVMTDSYGLQVNNETHQHLFIDAAGTDIFLYTGIDKPYCVIDSERAVPETWWGCQLERSPDSISRPMWLCSGGPRTSGEVLTYNGMSYAHFMDHIGGAVIYNATPLQNWYNFNRPAGLLTSPMKTQSGALLFSPLEFVVGGMYYGKIPQALLVDAGQAFKAELVVPIDTGVTGTFKVTGGSTINAQRICRRKA